MTLILAAAGVLPAASVLPEIKGCGCKRSKIRIICLIVCAALYTIGLFGHFGLINAAADTAADTDTDTQIHAGCH